MSDYIENGCKHLNNTTVYEALSHDPTEGMEATSTKCFRDEEYIDEHELKFKKPKEPPRTQYVLSKETT